MDTTGLRPTLLRAHNRKMKEQMLLHYDANKSFHLYIPLCVFNKTILSLRFIMPGSLSAVIFTVYEIHLTPGLV